MQKSTQTRIVRKITDKIHPYIFSQTLLHENAVLGCILSVIFRTILVCVLFCTSIPTYLVNLLNFLLVTIELVDSVSRDGPDMHIYVAVTGRKRTLFRL